MRGFFLAVAIFVVLGAVAATAYQLGITNAAGVAAGATPVAAAYPYYWHPFWGFGFFGFLFPLFFLFVIFGIARAAFGGGGHWRSERRRMLEQWHHEMHEHGRSETADR